MFSSSSTRLDDNIAIEKTAQLKLCYLMGRKVRKNLARSNYKEGIIQHFQPGIQGIVLHHLTKFKKLSTTDWRTEKKHSVPYL